MKIRKQWKVEEIIDDIQDYKQKWNQHVVRMPENKLPRKSLQYQPQGKRDLVTERELITQNCEWKKKKKRSIKAKNK